MPPEEIPEDQAAESNAPVSTESDTTASSAAEDKPIAPGSATEHG